MAKILLTGGTGFLGSYIIRDLLVRGYQIRALKRPNSPMSMLGEYAGEVEWVDGDVLDVLSLERAMRGIEEVYHCSAVVSMRKSDRQRMFQINAGGTANVINEALSCGVSRLLHVSSIAAIGRKEGSRRVDEDIKWETNSLNTDYAVSKHLAEREVYRGIAEGLTAVIVNPSMIIGAGFWNRGTAAIFKRVYDGLKFYTAGRTGLVDVRDVSNAAIELMQRGKAGKRFIINGANMDFKTFFQHVSKAMGISPPKFEAGKLSLGIAWRVEWLKSVLTGKEPVITRSSAMIARERFEFDSSRLQSEIGFEFRPLENTIAETARAFLQSQNDKINYGILPF